MSCEKRGPVLISKGRGHEIDILLCFYVSHLGSNQQDKNVELSHFTEKLFVARNTVFKRLTLC